LDVAKSALQKYIRRCNYEKAIYAGAELDLFYMMPEKGEGIRTNLIHRLMVIYMEDVFDPYMWDYIDELIFQLLELRKKRDSDPDHIRKQEMDALTCIIYLLSQAPHSRENSYYRYCLFIYPISKPSAKREMLAKFPSLKNIDDMLSITFQPSFSIKNVTNVNVNEMITQFLGALESRHEIVIYYAHRITELEKSPLPIKCYRSTKPVYLIFYLMDTFFTHIKDYEFKRWVELGVKWHKELSPLKEDFLTWQHILLLWLKRDVIGDKNDYTIPDGLPSLYDVNMDEKDEIKFDEWVYDMHTKVGKQRGKDTAYFAIESSKVCNEVKHVNQLYKNIYTYRKLLDDKYGDYRDYIFDDISSKKDNFSGITKESELGDFLVRAQLVTGNSKTDTYYIEHNGKIFFVKGPLVLSNEELSTFLWIQSVKEELGLDTLHYRVLHLTPDRFGKTPLGIRNRLDVDKKYPFLVCDALFSNKPSEIPIRLHSSKLWPLTELVDFDQIKDFTHFESGFIIGKDDMTKKMVKNLVFRYVFGLGDIAKRNFLIKGNRLISIDEDVFDKDFDLEENLKRTKGLYDLFVKYDKKELIEELKPYLKTEGMRHRFDYIVTTYSK
jgi:hypothetical protein